MRDYPKKKQKKPPRLERALAALMNQPGTWLDISFVDHFAKQRPKT